MKKYLASLTLISALVVYSCRGGGSSTTLQQSITTKITLSGTVDSQSTSLSGSSSAPVANATVHIVDVSGNEVATTTTNSQGIYSAQVSKLTIYGVTVDLPSSKPSDRTAGTTVKMKAVAHVADTNATLDINPGSTAAVLVLQEKLNVIIGVSGVGTGTALTNLDLSATVTAIYNVSGFTPLAVAVEADVASHTDPTTDAAVLTLAQTVASAVTVVTGTATTTGTGTVTTSTNDPALIGTWVETSGTPAGATLAFTANSMTISNNPPAGTCSGEIDSYTTSGNVLYLTVSTASALTNCRSVGYQSSAPYSILGNTLTLSNSSGVPDTFTKSSVPGPFDGTYAGTWSRLCPTCGNALDQSDTGTFTIIVVSGIFTNIAITGPVTNPQVGWPRMDSGTVSSSGTVSATGTSPTICSASPSTFTGQITASSGGDRLTMTYTRPASDTCAAESGTLTGTKQ